MIPHPRRVFSCHGDGGQQLSLGRRSAGCIGEILLFDEFGQIRTVVFAEATLVVLGDAVYSRQHVVSAPLGLGSKPLFRIDAAPCQPVCAGLGADRCDPPPSASERPGIPKSEPRPDRCLRLIPRVEDAVATVAGLRARLIRVSVNGCGLHFADMEVRHEIAGRAVLRLEFAWHHRVFVSCSWAGSPPPFSVARAVTQAIDAAFTSGMDDDLEV